MEEAPYSAVRIMERLEEIGCDCKYTIIREYVRSKKKELNHKAKVRFETMPGLQAQVEQIFSYVRDNFMTGIKYQNLQDLNVQSMNPHIKVNKKVHQTINEIPLDRLKDEHLSPILREYILDNVNVRKVEKDCLISFTKASKLLYISYHTRKTQQF